jgi:hypothetical protein
MIVSSWWSILYILNIAVRYRCGGSFWSFTLNSKIAALHLEGILFDHLAEYFHLWLELMNLLQLLLLLMELIWKFDLSVIATMHGIRFCNVSRLLQSIFRVSSLCSVI